MPNLDEKLESLFTLLDKYLIADLTTMVEEIEPRESGGLGYTSIQVILSGMELLGFIISGGSKDDIAFNYFWDKYFTQTNQEYSNNRLKKIFRHSIRNGTAHYFLVKFGIQISKSNNGNLGKTKEGLLNVDVVTVFRDFQTAYEQVRNDLFNKNNFQLRNNAEKGIEELGHDLQTSTIEVEKYLEEKFAQIDTVQSLIGDSLTSDFAYGSTTPTTVSGTSFPSVTRLDNY